MPDEAWQDARPWQVGLIDEMRALLEPDPDVRALVIFGSWADPDLRDRFSDADFWLTTASGRMSKFFPAAGWIASIGPIFAIERSVRERHGVLRVCLDDMRRFDLIVVEEPTVERIDEWSGHPLRGPRKTVFSRSEAVDRAVIKVTGSVPIKGLTGEQFAAKVDDFWFVAQLTLHKAVRGDLMVATHLSMQLTRDCLELAMYLRDRRTGTRHPRGSPGDEKLLARLAPSHNGYTAATIIDAVEQACVLFDDLACEWDQEYRRKLPLLVPMILEARGAL